MNVVTYFTNCVRLITRNRLTFVLLNSNSAYGIFFCERSEQKSNYIGFLKLITAGIEFPDYTPYMNHFPALRGIFNEMGEISRFSWHFFKEAFKPRYEVAAFIRQCYIVGYSSLPLVSLTGFIIGLVLTMQLHPSLVTYGAESKLPGNKMVNFFKFLASVATGSNLVTGVQGSIKV